MNINEHLSSVTIPKMRQFLVAYDSRHNNPDYDILTEFMNLMFDMSDEEAIHAMVSGIANGDGTGAEQDISELINILFSGLRPDYELKKIEFNDGNERKNFIDYD